jgi:hypothetical protein
MKLVAALAVAVTLALPASSGGAGERVLGIDTTVMGMRLAWYDPATLTQLPGKRSRSPTTMAVELVA